MIPNTGPAPERLQQLERRNTWHWCLAATLLVCMGGAVVALYGIGFPTAFDELLPAPETRGTLAVGLLGLVVLFCLYIFHQQTQLRRMQKQLLTAQVAEESLRARLSGVASLFASVAEVGLELDLNVALQTLAEHVRNALHGDGATIRLAPSGAEGAPLRATAGANEGNEQNPHRIVLSVPLAVGDEVIGTIDVHRVDDIAFSPEDQRVVAAFASNIAVTIRNIRERHREVHAHQKAKLEAVGRLAGGVAHDFNNLLTAIRGYGDLMLRRLGPDDPVRRNAEEVVRAADRAARLTRQLLSFTRPEVRQATVLDLNDVMADMEGMLRQLIGEDVTLVTKAAPGLWSVRADRGQVEQLILNLAVNARDAMPGGGCLTMETANVESEDAAPMGEGHEAAGPCAVLRVTDTGIGMDEATQARLFEPFFTTKTLGRGTGLGLSTVYGIVRQGNGIIRVKSAPNRGTTFSVYLPRHEATSVKVAASGAETPAPAGWETILLVEDEDVVRDLAHEVLAGGGYRVLEARHGSEAIAASEGHRGPIHLLLTDVVMPGMSGCEVVDRLRTSRPEMGILYMSGYTGDILRHHGDPGPADALLQKPFSPDELIDRVREMLKARPNAEPLSPAA